MPLNSRQLAEMVERARRKAPPVISSPPQQTPSPRRPARPAAFASPPTPEPEATPVHPLPAIKPTAPDDFPTGWELKKESWHFHRRFYRVFRRPMECGEYSHLLWQIRRRTAEHLWEDCWRVTLASGDRTLPVRATRWQLITILPKDWLPPQQAPAEELAT
jgi:hypothetical protein